ncbi:5-methyltetrahydropteroyltriglutamate--homocysteine S-methyltransferase [Lentibacillus sp. N15]|uniref:5-methyltetrahydropteroyltriglutamate-- homocysteine S-methyltransferase n=1 Tax=Lentibacillus songyuanensis TaxID=3136161 RepID=UPI0031B9FD54
MSTTETKKRAPFQGDHVGSFLRPARLKQARSQYANGEITVEELRTVEDEEIVKLIEKQKQVGLKSITDGEFRRSWWHFDFLEGLTGVEGYDPDSGLHFVGIEARNRSIRITGKVDFDDAHPMLDHFRFLNNHVGPDHVAKMTIPSPNMLLLRGSIDPKVYGTIETLLPDLTNAYKKAIQAFYDLGCRYLQLDDTSWSSYLSEKGRAAIRERGYTPEEMQKIAARAINEAIAERPDDLLITMHICRGNYRSHYFAEGSYDAASETIFSELNVDGLFLEFDDERSGGFEPLNYVNRDDLYVVLGLITTKVGEIEDKQQIKKRIKDASDYLPLNQLCLSPQCGFASTEEGNDISEEDQWKKIRHVLEIADEVW